MTGATTYQRRCQSCPPIIQSSPYRATRPKLRRAFSTSNMWTSSKRYRSYHHKEVYVEDTWLMRNMKVSFNFSFFSTSSHYSLFFIMFFYLQVILMVLFWVMALTYCVTWEKASVHNFVASLGTVSLFLSLHLTFVSFIFLLSSFFFFLLLSFMFQT
jgi:hypothetical protein